MALTAPLTTEVSASFTAENSESPDRQPEGSFFATAPSLASPHIKKTEVPAQPESDEETEMSITDVIKKIVVIDEVPNFKNSFMDDLFAPDDDVDISEWWDDYVRSAFAGYNSAQGSPAFSKRRTSSSGG